MGDIHSDKEKVALEKKLDKAGRGDYITKIASASSDELEAELLKLSKYDQQIKSSVKNDEKLLEIADQLKELRRPYNESLNMNKTFRRLVGLTLEEKGKI